MEMKEQRDCTFELFRNTKYFTCSHCHKDERSRDNLKNHEYNIYECEVVYYNNEPICYNCYDMFAKCGKCKVCKEKFKSRNQLFQHLKRENHIV